MKHLQILIISVIFTASFGWYKYSLDKHAQLSSILFASVETVTK